MNVLEEQYEIVSVSQSVNLSYNILYCCRIIPLIKEDKKGGHWFERERIKLKLGLAWPEFYSADLEGVH
jgi:hypothetical protein